MDRDTCMYPISRGLYSIPALPGSMCMKSNNVKQMMNDDTCISN